MEREPEEAVPEEDRTESKDPEELQSEIEQTREEMGDTVEALGEKADVKSQTQDRVAEAKQRLADKREELRAKAREGTPESFDVDQAIAYAKQNPVPVAIGAFVLTFAVGRLSKRR